MAAVKKITPAGLTGYFDEKEKTGSKNFKSAPDFE